MVKDPALSLLWRGFNPWPGNFCIPQVWPKQKTKTSVLQGQVSKKVKRPPTEWEKISANHLSDTGQVPRMFKELLPLNTKDSIILRDFLKQLSGNESNSYP